MFFLFWIFSHDFTYIVSGSEDKYVYIWSTYHDLSKFTSVRRDRNDFWEGIKGKNQLLFFALLKLMTSKIKYFYLLSFICSAVLFI